MITPPQLHGVMYTDKLHVIQNINHFSSTGKFGDQSLEEIWDNGKYYKELMEQNVEQSEGDQ